VEIALDVYKMIAAKISFNDILNAIGGENTTISAGNIIAGGQRRSFEDHWRNFQSRRTEKLCHQK
jgi:multidrug efflux pump subunit AcrB